MPSFLKKSSSGRSCSRGTRKCAAARSRTSEVVFSSVRIADYLATIPARTAEAFRLKRSCKRSGKIRQSVVALNKFAEACFDGRARKEFTENVNFVAELVARDRLDELLGSDRCFAI